jgi:glycosyltransferase involved in cell wall biosynthesis
MKSRILFLTPGAIGGIRTQVELLSSACNSVGGETSIFVTSKRRGKASVFSIWRIILFTQRLLFDRPELVYIPLASNGSFYRKLVYASLIRLFGGKFVLHLHGGGLENFYQKLGKTMRRTMTLLFRSAIHVFILHEGQRIFAEEIMGDSKNDSVSVFPNGVVVPSNKSQYQAPEKFQNLRAIFIGDIKRRKGVDSIIELADFFYANGIKFTLVGKADHEMLKLFGGSLDRGSQSLNFVGELSHESAMMLLSKSHVLVLPSRVENFPNVILEALAYGVPVIASDIGAIREIIGDTEEAGWLLNSNKDLQTELVRVFSAILENRSSLNAHSIAARLLAGAKFDINVLGQKFMSKASYLIDG